MKIIYTENTNYIHVATHYTTAVTWLVVFCVMKYFIVMFIKYIYSFSLQWTNYSRGVLATFDIYLYIHQVVSRQMFML